jgi:AAHS family 4-hydroxybenzoate transporter-like MFS transporter
MTSPASAFDEGSVDVAAVIDRNPIGAAQLKIFALCLAVSILDGFDTMAMSFLAPAISSEWRASPTAIGLVFSATLLGGALGATVCGVLADQVGRKAMILASVLWFAVLTLACATAARMDALIAFRFLAGFGLGGAIPNILAMAGEYAPARRRSTVVSVATWGTPLGAVVGGLLAAPMIHAFGWRSVLYLAGLAPIALWPFLLLALPESVRFMALRQGDQDRLRRVLARIAPSEAIPPDARFVVTEAPPARSGLGALFRDGLAAGSILLSGAMFMSLILSFFLVNWTPTLLKQSGMPLKDAILGTVALNLSGVVGSLFIARLTEGRANAPRTLAFTYLLAVASVATCGLVTRLTGASLGPVMACLIASGFFLIGTQIALSAYITDFFPTAVRATGVGFNNAFARFGSLVGPAAGGLLLGAGVSPWRLLIAAAIPGGLSALFLFTLALHGARTAPQQG